MATYRPDIPSLALVNRHSSCSVIIMGDDDPPKVVITSPETSEATPLLGSEARHHGEGNGVFNGAVPSHAEEQVVVGDGSEVDAVRREGMPEVAARMHVLLPAICIGVFLCALDQLLVVATYPKIGSDLKALNNTSWVATACVTRSGQSMGFTGR
jgi:hypothetical protein